MYSILRNGLRDLSNSHMMKVGAALGAGIYVATISSIAAGYSQDNANNNYMVNYNYRQQNNYEAPQNYDNIPSQRYMLVVEFINDPAYNKNNNVHVITREADLRIRFYLRETRNNNSTTGGQLQQTDIDQGAAHDTSWYQMKYEELLLQTDHQDVWLPEETSPLEEQKKGFLKNIFSKKKSSQQIDSETLNLGNDTSPSLTS